MVQHLEQTQITDRKRIAFERLWEAERERVWRLCARLSSSTDAADDLAQEVSIRAWQAWGGFKGLASPRTWLHRIAVNVCLRWRERQKPTTMLDETLAGSVEGSPERLALQSDEKSRIHAALDRLPEDLRTSLVLHAWEGMAYREIAALLEIPVGTVTSRIWAARQRLKKELADAL
jgi:RNA polymerase sigma-70 factor, ECF subfamily